MPIMDSRSQVFLFAVARRVQRNRLRTSGAVGPAPACFYSLSLDAYSGTRK